VAACVLSFGFGKGGGKGTELYAMETFKIFPII
jgi:hypothetical protein